MRVSNISRSAPDFFFTKKTPRRPRCPYAMVQRTMPRTWSWWRKSAYTAGLRMRAGSEYGVFTTLCPRRRSESAGEHSR